MKNKKIRYAVVGLGWIAQEAVLPAFSNAKENSELTALVSDNPKKLKELAKKYKVSNLYSYDQYDECLKSGEIDAVYIALPNHMHAEYTIRAAEAGIHVLCEKPMAVTEEECVAMISAAEENNIKLMIAYRLHFEEGNLKAVEIANSGKLGDVRFFTSTFSMSVQAPDIRLEAEKGGGTLYDIGVYCINAARMIFKAEPIEVVAFCTQGKHQKFKEVDEMSSVTLHFPEDRFANFVTSFGAFKTSAYEVMGTKGLLRVNPAFSHNAEVKHSLQTEKGEKEKLFKARDHFAPELIYFSRCILKDEQPEPSGEEGLADVRVVEALYQSASEGRAIQLERFHKKKRPGLHQEIKKPKPREPHVVEASSPSGK